MSKAAMDFASSRRGVAVTFRKGPPVLKTSILTLSLFGLIPFFAFAADESINADLLLRGGTIYTGDGTAGQRGDVAIRNGLIVAVGQFKVGQFGRTIDCTGLCVAPGLIDLHTHSDDQVISPTLRGCVNYVIQGCTTSVTGNCGSGPTDVGEFYTKIDAAGAGTNVAHLLPQGALRERVIGSVDRPANAEDLTRMRELVDQAMRDGAWGMSTGLIYVPSVYASTDELIELARVTATHGGIYASHIRGEGRGLLTAVGEAMKIGEVAGLPVHISHFKSSGSENWGLIRQAAAAIEAARKQGRSVTADQYPYTASSTSLEATLFPTWARSGGHAALLKRLDDPESGPKIKAEVQRDIDRTDDGAAVFLARYQPRPAWVGKNLKQIAEESKRPALDIACEIVRNGGAAVVNFSMSEEDVRYAMQLPWVATASDGRSYLPNADRPHPRSYGTFARKIGRYAIRDQVVSLEHAIRSASGLPADILGLKDRGYLKPELAADIVIFDPKKYIDEATYDEPHHYASGVRYVFVNGVPAVHEGTPTGALAGKALRHAPPK